MAHSLVVIAVVSLTCIALSLSLYEHYDPKADLCVLVTVPGLCLTASMAAIFAKRVFHSARVLTSVTLECIWTMCFVIFNLILSLYSSGVGTDITGTRTHIPFLMVKICCWSLTGLMAAYSSLIIFLSVLTALTVDKDVWFRDITGSPSPFPVVICLHSVKLWLVSIRKAPSGVKSAQEHPPHCLPGCTCEEKIPPSSPSTALPPLGLLSDPPRGILANAFGVVPGVRVPTALERHNSIFVGLQV
ncbi:hypothetical protein BJV78DRAFT_1155139 [Lactifluus subvellereus]|nr:hypothetical protein BJV78DRAFT_1155139 [Lactifluus subvellereus]